MKHSGSLAFYLCRFRVVGGIPLSGLTEKGVYEFKLVEDLQVLDPFSHPNILNRNAKLV
jgi:hypothetical protein